MTRSRSDAVAVESSDHEAREAAECERALLGALLLDSARAWPQIKDVVNVNHLARADHRLIFVAASVLLYERGVVDGALVCDRLTAQNELEAAGGREYIAELVAETTSAANAGAYAAIIRDYANRSKVVSIMERTAARARLGTAADAIEDGKRELDKIDLGLTAQPLEPPSTASWTGEPEPRQWILEGLIPAGRVTSLLGNGGLGKTLVALQIALHVSLGRSLFGIPVKGGPVLGLFCEDEEAELHRRLRAACAAERVDLADTDRLYAVSRDGSDNMLCTFERDLIQLTPFYRQLEATIASLRPTLVILDTAADLFAGDFLSTPHVRQFIKIALNGLCVRHGCAVLLLGHPSTAGMASGDGGGFSTAWNNSVRSRLYLAQPKPLETEDDTPVDVTDKRVLEVKKSNYGPKDIAIPLLYQSGAFTLDPEPLGGVTQLSSARTKTARVALAALDYVRSKAPIVCGFRELFEALQSAGALPPGSYDDSRKPLNRALRQLLSDGIIVETKTPRGYRLNLELR